MAVPPDTPGAPDFSITNPTPTPAPAPAQPAPAVPSLPAPSDPQYVKRRIDVTFQLKAGATSKTGSFAGGSSGVKLSGLRCSASIMTSGKQVSQCHLRVYGMTLDQMNQLQTLGVQVNGQGYNLLTLEAGNDVTGMTQVFQGNITDAFFDGRAMPNTTFQIAAFGLAYAAVTPIKPTSLPGPSVDVSQTMQGFAKQCGLTFENHGVNVKLPTSYFWGTVTQQMRMCARAANINYSTDNGKLAIVPKTGASNTGSVPLISPDTGMIGYPTVAQLYVEAKCLFNTNIRLHLPVQVKSSLTAANGQWIVFELNHDLESETPGGAWFTTFKGSNAQLRGAAFG
jgi:hypothetical protein